MKTYQVGGAVRDELLGLPVKDRDYVVTGSTPEEMARLGFKPVGKDFPVFLHPTTHEEYALARTERKTARGYKGFQVYAAPDVTLEEDLRRRDLTINAMAREENGALIDPFDGKADLRAGVLRHVSEAFAEDPVRVLRVARFAARYENFSIAPETLELMRTMVANGEVDALVAERVWQELSRGLMQARPSRMFEALRACGALARILPEVDALFGVPQPADHHPEIDTGVHVMLVVDFAARQGYSLAVRFAALMHDLGKADSPRETWPKHHQHEASGVEPVRAVCERLRAPAEVRDTAMLVARHHLDVHRARELQATTVVRLLGKLDAFRRPERFEEILLACACDFHGRPGREGQLYPQADFLRQAFAAAREIDAGKIAGETSNSAAIAGKVHEARVRAVKKSTKESDA
jgi:tRNA nucleotidyltransferase (CCA-adding enzyme)